MAPSPETSSSTGDRRTIRWRSPLTMPRSGRWAMALAFSAASALVAMAVTGVVGSTPQASARNAAAAANPAPAARSSLVSQGKHTFRFDTFNDQAFWGGVLHLNRAIAGKANGGVGPGVSPKTALAVGLKVDVDALPASVKRSEEHTSELQ